MAIDPERFRTLVPIDSLDSAARASLVEHARLETLAKGAEVIRYGDVDSDFVYLHSGTVELTSADGQHKLLGSDSEQSVYPLANLKPRQFSARVASPMAEILRIDGRTLEQMLAWGQVSGSADRGIQITELEEIGATADASDQEWMLSLLKTKTFLRLPSGNIEKLFNAFEPIAVTRDQVIIRFGDPGDYYYVIKTGRCAVTRPSPSGEVLLADLGELQSFGEDALIANEPRNATVTMLTDGILMRLSKQDFNTLLREPLVKWVNLQEASALIRDGAIRIDVRTENEHAHNGIKGSLNIPLYMLRLKTSKLKPDRKYVLYCDTGVRSSAGAFIMAKKGLDVYVLEGGLTSALAAMQPQPGSPP